MRSRSDRLRYLLILDSQRRRVRARRAAGHENRPDHGRPVQALAGPAPLGQLSKTKRIRRSCRRSKAWKRRSGGLKRQKTRSQTEQRMPQVPASNVVPVSHGSRRPRLRFAVRYQDCDPPNLSAFHACDPPSAAEQRCLPLCTAVISERALDGISGCQPYFDHRLTRSLPGCAARDGKGRRIGISRRLHDAIRVVPTT